jgi:hypothetical protein
MALITNPLAAALIGSSDSDLIIGYAGNRILFGNGGNDYMLGVQHTDLIYGGEGNDTEIGWSGNDSVIGNQGNDLLLGHYDDDWLVGGQGFDTLYGGNGRDTLFGNQGANELVGGLGADRFAFQPTIRFEHEERQVTVLLGYHEETLVTYTIETIDPPPETIDPPPSEQMVLGPREEAPGRPDERSNREAWDNYVRNAGAHGFTLVEFAADDPQQLFPTYYRQETTTVTIDPPPYTIDPPPYTVETPHVVTTLVPDYGVQTITVDRTLLSFDGMAVITDFTPGVDHLWLAGTDVPALAATSVVARDVNGQLTLSYDGMDLAALVGHTASEYSAGWWL